MNILWLIDLKNYFDSNTREQIISDWEATKKYDNVGITIKEYIKLINNDK